ncbi:hypothetical protein FVR03_23570 [Pontibacter qinzhouensis]|uniref:Uncharacterized protein n=1 Tax=Pontibacter qinzhouensis TaxID=2603253 RepID=A0A5C8IHA1_9BACT|nr:hypothetical protein [Pontibacter qinzhouensis]TXK21143.1 hypothetical protein FVR03_23570 [Pontibacter qinzhouensis]
MKNDQQKTEDQQATDKNTATQATGDKAVEQSQDAEQTSGGAVPSIQGANQSREAEQNDLRK